MRTSLAVTNSNDTPYVCCVCFFFVHVLLYVYCYVLVLLGGRLVGSKMCTSLAVTNSRYYVCCVWFVFVHVSLYVSRPSSPWW